MHVRGENRSEILRCGEDGFGLAQCLEECGGDAVRRAFRGEINHDELVRILKTWPYQAQYKTTGLGDYWQTVPVVSMGSSSRTCRRTC